VWRPGCAAAVPGHGGVLWPAGSAGKLSPGGDICGQSFPYVPGGDEEAGHPHARVGGPV
jgi:hypothetical protein